MLRLKNLLLFLLLTHSPLKMPPQNVFLNLPSSLPHKKTANFQVLTFRFNCFEEEEERWNKKSLEVTQVCYAGRSSLLLQTRAGWPTDRILAAKWDRERAQLALSTAPWWMGEGLNFFPYPGKVHLPLVYWRNFTFAPDEVATLVGLETDQFWAIHFEDRSHWATESIWRAWRAVSRSDSLRRVILNMRNRIF